jgi:hypothetical protein
MAAATPEIVVPFTMPRECVAPATAARSTLIASSLKSIRERGLLDRYLLLLDPVWREPLMQAVAGVWLPIDAGVAHYQACGALGLTSAEQFAIGREVGERVNGTFLAAMVRAAKTVGVTPWNALGYSGRLYARVFAGGGICVSRVGPKEALCEIVRNPVAGVPYFRSALRGVYTVACELFCAKAYVHEVAARVTETSCSMRMSWA